MTKHDKKGLLFIFSIIFIQRRNTMKFLKYIKELFTYTQEDKNEERNFINLCICTNNNIFDVLKQTY